MASRVKEFLSQQRRLVVLVLATLPVMFAYQNCGSVGSQKMLASGGNGPVLIVDPGFTDPALAATVQQVNQIKTQTADSEAQGTANCTSVDSPDSSPVRKRGDVTGLTYTTSGQNPDGIDHEDVYELVDLVLRKTFNTLQTNDKWLHAALHTDLNCDGALSLDDVVKLLSCVKGEVSIPSCVPDTPIVTASPTPTPYNPPPGNSPNPTPSPVPSPVPSPYVPKAFMVTPNPYEGVVLKPYNFHAPQDGSQPPCSDYFISSFANKIFWLGNFNPPVIGSPDRGCITTLNESTGKFTTHFGRNFYTYNGVGVEGLLSIQVPAGNGSTYLYEFYDTNLNYVGNSSRLSNHNVNIVRDGENIYISMITANAMVVYKSTVQEYISSGGASIYDHGVLRPIGQKVATIKGTGTIVAVKNNKLIGHYLEGNRFYSHDLSLYAPDWEIGDTQPTGYYSDAFGTEVVKHVKYRDGTVYVLTYVDGGTQDSVHLYKSTNGTSFSRAYTFGPNVQINGSNIWLQVEAGLIFVNTTYDQYTLLPQDKPFFVSTNGGSSFTRLQVSNPEDRLFNFAIANGVLYAIRMRIANGLPYPYREFVKFNGAVAQPIKDVYIPFYERKGLSFESVYGSGTKGGVLTRSIFSWNTAVMPLPSPVPTDILPVGVYKYSVVENGVTKNVYRKITNVAGASYNYTINSYPVASVEESTQLTTSLTPLTLPGGGLICGAGNGKYYLRIKCVDSNNQIRKYLKNGSGFVEIASSIDDNNSTYFSTPKYFYYSNSTGTYRLLKTSTQPLQPIQMNTANTIVGLFGTSILSNFGLYSYDGKFYLSVENGPNLALDSDQNAGVNISGNFIYNVRHTGMHPMYEVRKYNFDGQLIDTKQVELFQSNSNSYRVEWVVDPQGIHNRSSGHFLPMSF